MSRTIELILTTTLLILAAPVMLLVALAIRLDSRGPFFYRQERVGKDGTRFMLLKFRKMPEDLPKQGPMLSGRFDPRFTKVGRFLERTKLDELPQLFNVLKGDMALVGPRPEVPRFTKFYPEKWEIVLSVKPGVVGLNQVVNRNESELFPGDCFDVEANYVDTILPQKLDIDIEYIQHRNLWMDVWILLRWAWVTIFGTFTTRSLESFKMYFAILAVDTTLAAVSYVLAYNVRFAGEISYANISIMLRMLPSVCLIRAAAFVLYKMPRQLPGFFSVYEIGVVLWSVVVGSVWVLVAAFILGERAHSRAVILIDSAFLTIMMVGYRWAWARLSHRRKRPSEPRKMVIVGVNHETVWVLETLRRHGRASSDITGVIDTDAGRRSHRVAGVEIIGLTNEMELLLEIHRIAAVIAIESALPESIQERIKEICERKGVRYIPVPAILSLFETVAHPAVSEVAASETTTKAPAST